MTDSDIVARIRAITWTNMAMLGSDALCHEAADEIERLQKKLLGEENAYDILRVENEHLQTDRNNLSLMVDRLTKERDEARRMVCKHNYIRGGINPLQYAQMMHWDCYDKTPNDTKDYASRGR